MNHMASMWGVGMQFFINFVLESVGYFITIYFVYSIFGYKKKIAYGLLGLLLIASLYPFLNIPEGLLTWQEIVLFITMSVGPVVFAGLIFISISGGMPMIKIKRRQTFKGVSNRVLTKQMNIQTSYLVMIGSLIAGSSSYFVFQDVMRYMIMGISLIAFILGIILYVQANKIIEEKVVLLVGKNKEKIYTASIHRSIKVVDIKDFYHDEGYIVDRIGEIYIETTEKKEIRHYLFWLATSDQVSIGEPFEKVSLLSYGHLLSEFEKYHVKRMWVRELRRGDVEKIKEKLIR